jgi:uncharacterized protein with ParB-like and HNH nuclease domain
MDTQLLSLSKIFTERLFRIPDYQRGYAWTEAQLKDFWSDIEQLEEGRNHYTGVLTLEAVSSDTFNAWADDLWIIKSKSFRPFYVVDGQQRLTTTIILVQAILDRLKDGDVINYNSREETRKKYIYDSKDGGISRSYIFGYERDNPSYEYLKTEIFGEQSCASFDAQETIYTANLENAKAFFSARIDQLNFEQREVIFRRVTQNLLFNIFTIEEDVDVFVAFETMNNRGKPLSCLELLKNRLIYLSLKLKVDDYERSKLRQLINDAWRVIYHNLGRNKDSPLDDDEFLRGHLITYFSDYFLDADGHRGFYRKFQGSSAEHYLLKSRFISKNVISPTDPKDEVNVHSINDYTISLQQSVEVWYNLLNPLSSDFSPDLQVALDKLVRLGAGRSFAPLVMVAFRKEKNPDKRLELLHVLERYMYFAIFLIYRRMYVGDGFAEHAAKLSSGKSTIDVVIKELTEHCQRMADDVSLRKNAMSEYRRGGFYQWDGIRYFLFEYNLDLQKRARETRPKIFWPEFNEVGEDFVTIEHIYPRQAKDKYWTDRFAGFTAKQRGLLRESLGNLLPLSRRKNAALQNYNFDRKVEGDGENLVGFRYGSYAENLVSAAVEWTPDCILKRGLEMLGFMEKRWNINLGTREEKLKLLGIDFLELVEPSQNTMELEVDEE